MKAQSKIDPDDSTIKIAAPLPTVVDCVVTMFPRNGHADVSSEDCSVRIPAPPEADPERLTSELSSKSQANKTTEAFLTEMAPPSLSMNLQKRTVMLSTFDIRSAR
jgi:hypothetical protein